MDLGETRARDSQSSEQGTQEHVTSPLVSSDVCALGAPTSPIISNQTRQPFPSNSFLRTQLSGNEFSSSDLITELGHAVSDNESHQYGPKLFLEPVDGKRRQLEDEDYTRQSNAGFDSDQQDEFASIKTIDDLGFTAWLQSPNSSQDQATSEALVNGGPDTADRDVLTGVGSFASSSHRGSRASAEDIENYLDVEAVGDDLRDSFQTSKAGNSRFLPLDRLCDIVNNEVIRRLLRNDCPGITDEELEERTRQVCGHDEPSITRRKIFSILILIGKVESTLSFIHADICDAHLPLKLEWKRKRYSIRKRGNVPPASTSDYFRNWLKRDFEAFDNTQAYMLAPYFELRDDQVCFYKLDDNQIVLPFTEYEPRNQGGYGRVFKVKIHKAHHSFKMTKNFADDNPYFAVKEIHSNDPEGYRKEVEVLEKFSGVNKGHSHLVRLLLTYRYNEKYYLLFHWANGNLREFWRRFSEPPISPKHVRWLITQCRGIAAGLRKIHHATTWPKEPLGNRTGSEKEWGRHGDIKPENILWFAHPNDHLVISDFGLTRYHSLHSRSQVPHNKVPGYSNTYRPPEFDLKNAISQKYDIWTLGCLYLEFLSWFLRGDADTQKTFSQERLDDMDDGVFGSELQEDKFFNLYLHDGSLHSARVKSSVKKWINNLHALPKCSDFFHMFLDMIEHHLLVPEAKDRWDCNQVCAELERIFTKCQDDSDYCIKGIPREAVAALGTPRQTIGELRGPEFRDQSLTTSHSPLLDASRHDSDALYEMEASFHNDLAMYNEEIIERLLPTESTSQPSSAHKPVEINRSDNYPLPSRQAPGSSGAEIHRANVEPDPQEQRLESLKDRNSAEPPPALVHDSARISDFPNQNSDERGPTSSLASNSPLRLQNSDEGFKAMPAIEELEDLSTHELETGKNSVQGDDRTPTSLPEAETESLDPESAVEGPEPPDLPTDNQDAAEQPAEESHDRPGPHSIAAETPPQDVTVEPPLAPENTVSEGLRSGTNNPTAERPAAQTSATEEFRPPKCQLPRKNRVKRYWDTFMEECRSCSCFPHAGEARA